VKRSLPVVFALWLAVSVPSAAAQVPTQDSVTGSATTGAARSSAEFTFDVHSGPSGENPVGTVTLDTFFGPIGPLDVSCLSVNGSRASMFADAPPNTSDVAGLLISVEDNGAGQDRIDYRVATVAPTGCPVPSAVYTPTNAGDVSVTDAQPPATYAQCRQAGWVTYGYAAHAQCITAVHDHARKKCLFERAFTGIGPFREKYGVGSNHDFAMRRCVRRYTGL
jgi:hypothetical protein